MEECEVEEGGGDEIEEGVDAGVIGGVEGKGRKR
jgi:hypothetical protein